MDFQPDSLRSSCAFRAVGWSRVLHVFGLFQQRMPLTAITIDGFTGPLFLPELVLPDSMKGGVDNW